MNPHGFLRRISANIIYGSSASLRLDSPADLALAPAPATTAGPRRNTATAAAATDTTPSAQSTMGPTTATSDHDLVQLDAIYNEILATIGAVRLENFLPLLHRLPTPHMRKVWDLRRRRDAAMDTIVLEKRAFLAAQGPGYVPADLLECLLTRQDEYNLTHRQVLPVCPPQVPATATPKRHVLCPKVSCHAIFWHFRCLRSARDPPEA